jgi:hypothetical protein
MSTNATSRSNSSSDLFTRLLQLLAAIVFIKWLAIGLSGSFSDAPHAFLVFFCLTFLIAAAIRNRLRRTSGVIAFLFSLWFSVFVIMSAFGDRSEWEWFEYMITFIGGPLGLIIVLLSAKRMIKKS